MRPRVEAGGLTECRPISTPAPIAECGNRFELVQSFTDPSVTECPVCNGAVRKVYGSVGVVFKGSGFYRNDSRSGERHEGVLGRLGEEVRVEVVELEVADAKSDQRLLVVEVRQFLDVIEFVDEFVEFVVGVIEFRQGRRLRLSRPQAVAAVHIRALGAVDTGPPT